MEGDIKSLPCPTKYETCRFAVKQNFLYAKSDLASSRGNKLSELNKRRTGSRSQWKIIIP